ncbi:MAG: hypothetical protein LBN40_03035 [Oscillospiraceae bacterium]|nr:hypothetical protein [Oscillospiraceae bacterium]
MNQTKSMYIVLSASPTVLSRAIRRFMGDTYSHAALSFDENLTYMFSFGRRRAWNPFIGCFKLENIGEGLYKRFRSLSGIIIEIKVTEEQYNLARRLTSSFLLNADTYRYNYLGLAGNLVGIDHYSNTRFFCSEFVYHILHESGIFDLGIPRGLVRPQTLLRLNGGVVYSGDLKQYHTVTSTMTHTFNTPRKYLSASL